MYNVEGHQRQPLQSGNERGSRGRGNKERKGGSIFTLLSLGGPPKAATLSYVATIRYLAANPSKENTALVMALTTSKSADSVLVL